MQVAAAFDLAIDHEESALLMFGGNGQAAARHEAGIGIEDGRECLHRRGQAEAGAGDHPQDDAFLAALGQILRREMLEGGRGFLIGLGQADPALDAVHAVTGGARLSPRALGMGDAAPRRHPVDVAGTDVLHAAQRVAVHLRAVEQIGDGGQPDMGMGPHIDALAGRKFHRPEIVEEDEGADAAPRRLRQHPGDGEAVAQVVALADNGDHGASLSIAWRDFHRASLAIVSEAKISVVGSARPILGENR